jgi:hypothetical protein
MHDHLDEIVLDMARVARTNLTSENLIYLQEPEDPGNTEEPEKGLYKRRDLRFIGQGPDRPEPAREEFVSRNFINELLERWDQPRAPTEEATLIKIPLQGSEKTLQHKDSMGKEIFYSFRAYGSPETQKPSVFILSEDPATGEIPEFRRGNLQSETPLIAHNLARKHGLSMGSTTFVVHYPENVHGVNPERFVRAVITYDDKSPRWNYKSRDMSTDELAGLIGRENLESGYLATPAHSRNTLAMQALSPSLEPTP